MELVDGFSGIRVPGIGQDFGQVFGIVGDVSVRKVP